MLSGHYAAQEISLAVVLLELKSSILRKVSVCPRGPKAVLFHLTIFLLEALHIHASYVNSILYMCRP